MFSYDDGCIVHSMRKTVPINRGLSLVISLLVCIIIEVALDKDDRCTFITTT
jgi:hypothetical protein